MGDALSTWARVALLSFGGPAGQIAVMHRILVEEKRWISEERFLHALNFCMLLPGPEAQQLATYIGWLRQGTRGGLLAGGLFVLPGFVAIMVFSIVYVTWGNHPLVAGLFLGLKAAVLALIVEALLRIGRRALRSRLSVAIAVLAFIALFLFRAPFPLVVIAAGLFGMVGARIGRGDLLVGTAVGDDDSHVHENSAPSWRRAARTLAVWVPLWLLPVAALTVLSGPARVFGNVGLFFSKMAVVTFGGAYAVLSYVAQQAVQHYQWLSAAQMLDGLALAETTPGPLIMVVQFVGFLAGYQTPGFEHPLIAGVLAACLTVWVTFAPCFLWIFLGAPYVESLRRHAGLSSALAAITAAVVGVIANLALWFSLHALFGQVERRAFGGLLMLDVPVSSSVNWPVATLMAVAFGLTFLVRWNMARMLLICALLGVGFAGLQTLG